MQKHSQILLLLLPPYIITYEEKFTTCQESSRYSEKYEWNSLSMLLKGKYFLLRLLSIGFGPVLGFTFSFLPSLQSKLYRGTNLLFHSEGVESTLNSSDEVEA